MKEADSANGKPIFFPEDLRTWLEFVSISMLWLWYTWSAATLASLWSSFAPFGRDFLSDHLTTTAFRSQATGHLILVYVFQAVFFDFTVTILGFPRAGVYLAPSEQHLSFSKSSWIDALTAPCRNEMPRAISSRFGILNRGKMTRHWCHRCHSRFLQVELPLGKKEKKEKKEKDKKDKKGQVTVKAWIFKSIESQKFSGHPNHLLISPMWGEESKCRQRRWRCC